MKKMKRIEFMKELGRWGVLAGLVGTGMTFGSRKDKVTCSDRCGGCPVFENGKCGIGLKQPRGQGHGE